MVANHVLFSFGGGGEEGGPGPKMPHSLFYTSASHTRADRIGRRERGGRFFNNKTWGDFMKEVVRSFFFVCVFYHRSCPAVRLQAGGVERGQNIMTGAKREREWPQALLFRPSG